MPLAYACSKPRILLEVEHLLCLRRCKSRMPCLQRSYARCGRKEDDVAGLTTATGKLMMGILALIAEFEDDIRRERQLDGIAKAKERGVRKLRRSETVPEIMRQTGLSKASAYRALGS